MNIVMATTGSHGDILPLVGLGRALRNHGHEVTLVSSGDFRGLTRSAGLEFVEEMSADFSQQLLQAHNNHRSAPELREAWLNELGPRLRRVYAAIADSQQQGETVVLAYGIELYAAQAAAARMDVPYVRVYHESHPLWLIQPAVTGIPAWATTRAARWYERLGGWYRPMAERVGDFRTELGLPRMDKHDGELFCPPHLVYSPQLNLALFPKWFAPWYGGFPPKTVMASFPLYDTPLIDRLPDEVERFLAAGSPPVAFAVPSWKRDVALYFRESIEACRRLGRRAIVLSVGAETLPDQQDDDVLAARYLPYSLVLPRVAAFVHGGGIGTCGAALAAGVPQLCVPWKLDQPHNSRRVQSLGAGTVLSRRRYRAEQVSRALSRSLHSRNIRDRCQHWAAQIAQGPGLGGACEAIERLPRSDEGVNMT